MTKKDFFILCLLVHIPCTASAFPTPIDGLTIVNRTNEDIFIEVEYWEEPREMGVVWLLETKISDLEIETNIFLYASIITLNTNRQMVLLSFNPKWFLTSIDGRSPYEFMRAIPMLERIRSVVKSFKITNGQGDLLFSLENAREEDLTVKSPGGMSLNYILEISNVVTQQVPGAEL
jgi:hypothetical protein